MRSGLAEYGRNNITYVGDWGSFIQLYTFFSDAPAGNHTWREVRAMDACGGCGLCLDSCPTGAIRPGRFLIDTERCLSRLNEWGTDPFPDWAPRSAHHRLIGCLRCQSVCPLNRAALAGIQACVEFSAEETAYLLAGRAHMPAPLVAKAEACGIDLSFESLPRNLQAMFDAARWGHTPRRQ